MVVVFSSYSLILYRYLLFILVKIKVEEEENLVFFLIKGNKSNVIANKFGLGVFY